MGFENWARSWSHGLLPLGFGSSFGPSRVSRRAASSSVSPCAGSVPSRASSASGASVWASACVARGSTMGVAAATVSVGITRQVDFGRSRSFRGATRQPPRPLARPRERAKEAREKPRLSAGRAAVEEFPLPSEARRPRNPPASRLRSDPRMAPARTCALCFSLLLLSWGCGTSGRNTFDPDGGSSSGGNSSSGGSSGSGPGGDGGSTLIGDGGTSSGGPTGACAAASSTQTNAGCEYYAVDPDVDLGGNGGCFTAYVANTGTSSVTLAVDFKGQSFDVSKFAYIATGSGANIQYAPIANGVLPAGEVALLFLDDVPGANDGIGSARLPGRGHDGDDRRCSHQGHRHRRGFPHHVHRARRGLRHLPVRRRQDRADERDASLADDFLGNELRRRRCFRDRRRPRGPAVRRDRRGAERDPGDDQPDLGHRRRQRRRGGAPGPAVDVHDRRRPGTPAHAERPARRQHHPVE